MTTATTLALAVLTGLFPPLIWLFFWLREDSANSEPRSLLMATFCGGMIAVIGAMIAEEFLARAVQDESVRYILWSATEEILKFAFVAMIALKSRFNDEPIDAMIYCITAALGFAALENMFFVIKSIYTGSIMLGIINGNMRFMGATLVHTVSSAIVGFSLGIVYYRGNIAKFFSLFTGLLTAIILHSAFNLAIVGADPEGVFKTFAWIWGAIVIMIVLFEEIKSIKPKQIIQ